MTPMAEAANYWLEHSDFGAIPARESGSECAPNTPQVSVLMLAWNHAPFIDQAIESIVTQRCDFPFELIIGEDCSSDDTLSRCRFWHREFSDRIRVVTFDENVGMHRNFSRIWHRARAPLVALCEGDDYWVDQAKLKSQVDWFNAHPEGSLVGTLTDRISVNAEGEWAVSGRSEPPEIKESYSLRELLRHYSFHFSSVMVRKSAVRFPRWFWDVYCVDRPLYLLAAEHGKAGLLPVVTSRYRQHAGGVWSPRNPLEKAAASKALFRRLESHFGTAFRGTCRETLAAVLWSYMFEAIQAGDRKAARKLFWQCVQKHPAAILRTQGRIVPAAGLRLHWPQLYRALGGTPFEGNRS